MWEVILWLSNVCKHWRTTIRSGRAFEVMPMNRHWNNEQSDDKIMRLRVLLLDHGHRIKRMQVRAPCAPMIHACPRLEHITTEYSLDDHSRQCILDRINDDSRPPLSVVAPTIQLTVSKKTQLGPIVHCSTLETESKDCPVLETIEQLRLDNEDMKVETQRTALMKILQTGKLVSLRLRKLNSAITTMLVESKAQTRLHTLHLDSCLGDRVPFKMLSNHLPSLSRLALVKFEYDNADLETLNSMPCLASLYLEGAYHREKSSEEEELELDFHFLTRPLTRFHLIHNDVMSVRLLPPAAADIILDGTLRMDETFVHAHCKRFTGGSSMQPKRKWTLARVSVLLTCFPNLTFLDLDPCLSPFVLANVARLGRLPPSLVHVVCRFPTKDERMTDKSIPAFEPAENRTNRVSRLDIRSSILTPGGSSTGTMDIDLVLLPLVRHFAESIREVRVEDVHYGRDRQSGEELHYYLVKAFPNLIVTDIDLWDDAIF